MNILFDPVSVRSELIAAQADGLNVALLELALELGNFTELSLPYNCALALFSLLRAASSGLIILTVHTGVKSLNHGHNSISHAVFEPRLGPPNSRRVTEEDSPRVTDPFAAKTKRISSTFGGREQELRALNWKEIGPRVVLALKSGAMLPRRRPVF